MSRRHEWLQGEGVQHVTAVLQADCPDEVSAEEMSAELARIVGDGEVAAIESIESLRAGEPLPGCYEAVADTAFRRTFSSTALATSQRAVGASSGPDGLCAQLGEGARLAMCGEDEHTLSRFLVLFRRRRIAAIVVGMSRWPGELLSSPGHVRAVAAPPPADVYWPNLLRPRWRLRVNRAIAVTLTSILFLFWTVPVGAVQALASARHLARIPALRWLAKTIQRFGPAATATLEGYLSATVLQAALWLTLSSGLFESLARLLGCTSEAEVAARAVERIYLFQLLLVLLASNIASSLYFSMLELIVEPLRLPVMLAQNLPGQATFFMHYVLNSLLYSMMLEATQAFRLIRLLAHLACGGGPPKERRDESLDAERGRLQHINLTYARHVLLSGVWLTFFLIAPLAPFFALIYFVPSYFLSALLLRHQEGRPALETGGRCWEGAMRYQNWSFIIALMLLLGIMVLKRTMGGSLLVLVALVYTMVRTARLRRRYEAKAGALSLQQIVEVEKKGREWHESLMPYARADAELDDEPEEQADLHEGKKVAEADHKPPATGLGV